MKAYFNLLFDENNRRITLVLLLTGFSLTIIGNMIGIADNPPGIIVAFLGILLLFFAFVHQWRSSKSYLILAVVSLLSGIVFAVLHNVFATLAGQVESNAVLSKLIVVISTGSFLIAVMICPVGIFAGLFGALLNYFLRRNPIKKTAE